MFAGVHGDAGGNYREAPDGERLALIPLLWMMEKAEAALGLDLRPGALEALREAADPLAAQHDSLDELWKFAIALGPIDAINRPMGNAAGASAIPRQKFPLVETDETIHPSVRAGSVSGSKSGRPQPQQDHLSSRGPACRLTRLRRGPKHWARSPPAVRGKVWVRSGGIGGPDRMDVAEADRDPVPHVDHGHDREGQLDQLRLRELRLASS